MACRAAPDNKMQGIPDRRRSTTVVLLTALLAMGRQMFCSCLGRCWVGVRVPRASNIEGTLWRAAGWLTGRWREFLPPGLGQMGQRSEPPAVALGIPPHPQDSFNLKSCCNQADLPSAHLPSAIGDWLFALKPPRYWNRPLSLAASRTVLSLGTQKGRLGFPNRPPTQSPRTKQKDKLHRYHAGKGLLTQPGTLLESRGAFPGEHEAAQSPERAAPTEPTTMKTRPAFCS